MIDESVKSNIEMTLRKTITKLEEYKKEKLTSPYPLKSMICFSTILTGLDYYLLALRDMGFSTWRMVDDDGCITKVRVGIGEEIILEV